MQHLTSALQGTPLSRSDGKITAIQKLHNALNNCGGDMNLNNQEPAQRQSPPSTKDKLDKRRSPRVQPPAPGVHLQAPRVHIPRNEVRPYSPRVPTESKSRLVAKHYQCSLTKMPIASILCSCKRCGARQCRLS